MKPYDNVNWGYTQEESLEIDQEKLSNANAKLKRNINDVARNFYEKEKAECEENIKLRIDFILNNK